MNQQTLSAPREHHFYVAIAKYLFHHPEYGVVSVQDPIKIKDAEQYGLSPLILYGVTVSGLPIQWITFSHVDQPRAIYDVLLEAWMYAEGLRGRPDILWINRHTAIASPDLAQKMAKIEVQVAITDSKEKSHPASLRSAQKRSKELFNNHDRKDRFLPRSIQALCRDAQYDHNFQIEFCYSCANKREIKDKIKQWLALPATKPTPTLTGSGLDWKPGSWLSSWESSLPPDRSRYFSFDGYDGKAWLITGENEPEDIIEDDNFQIERVYDNVAELTKSLIACWPNRPVEISKCAGITLRDLQWFISGKASLDQHNRFHLEGLLGIEYDLILNSYIAVGPYVLMARNPKELINVYDNLSFYRDVSPFEIIPHQGVADPSWRYYLIITHGMPTSIFMSPRGAKITDRLPDLLLNFDGIIPVSQEFYRDVVSTCARACSEPSANIREMKAFVKRYEEDWTDYSWQED